MATVRSDRGIVRAMLAVEMSDGTILRLEGKPIVEEFTVSTESQLEQIDLGLVLQKLAITPSRTCASFNGRWEQPMMSISYATRGWRERFKHWLKAFPIS